jgi:hypothetical protein
LEDLAQAQAWYGCDRQVHVANRWLGIPPVPAWLTWFGRPYAPLVRDAFARDVRGYAQGLARPTNEPVGLAALADRRPNYPAKCRTS